MHCADAFRDALESIGFERACETGTEPGLTEHTTMNENKERSTPALSYADAHAIHYSERDLPAALRSYHQLIALHPGAPEAGYARTQMRNIVKSVIPAKELLAAELALALRYLQPEDGSPAAVSP
jgi:hypothetical protein